jgi:hypothetical protein
VDAASTFLSNDLRQSQVPVELARITGQLVFVHLAPLPATIILCTVFAYLIQRFGSGRPLTYRWTSAIPKASIESIRTIDMHTLMADESLLRGDWHTDGDRSHDELKRT